MRSFRSYVVRVHSGQGWWQDYCPPRERYMTSEENLQWAARMMARYGQKASVYGSGGTMLLPLDDNDRVALNVEVARFRSGGNDA